MANPKKRAARSQEVILPALTAYPTAVKRMISHQIEREMLRQKISQAEMARQMETSRAAVGRLLDPGNTSVTLQTLERIAQLLGKRLQVFLAD